MRILKSAVLWFPFTLIACGQAPSETTQSQPAAPVAAAAEKYVQQGAGGRLNGRAFTVEQARLDNDILVLRSGKEFFPERELKVFFFDKSTKENREILADGSGGGSPHIHVSWRDEGDSLPNTETLMQGYDLAIKFGAATEFGVPFAIHFRTDKVADTEVSGTGFATFEDVRVVDGKLDRTYDSFGILRYIAREYLRAAHSGEIEVLGHFGGRYSSSDKPFPHTGFLGLEYRVEGKPVQMAKLQMLKDASGWRVAHRLQDEQISEAHPLFSDPDSPPGPRSGTMLEVAAARFVEGQLQRDGLMPKVRYTDARCRQGRSHPWGSCRITYGLKNDGGKECRVHTLLMQFKDDHWQVVRMLENNQQIVHATGELEEYEPREPSCG
jgi:hypothetical protein